MLVISKINSPRGGRPSGRRSVLTRHYWRVRTDGSADPGCPACPAGGSSCPEGGPPSGGQSAKGSSSSTGQSKSSRFFSGQRSFRASARLSRMMDPHPRLYVAWMLADRPTGNMTPWRSTLWVWVEQWLPAGARHAKLLMVTAWDYWAH